ncbi:peptide/nickel transport system substrate-binding protein [Kribbella sp. VKM Ac-2569]|uniref:ABC transporter substrate-binding protein n=1 Tax=Kribbella sp. VKM Ac-2569 TaxID=2512220 RepID=UPI00102C9B55|nr:ABC transporter substrate-binding protein [Kribbella sp. VKM Ac-2569]RZT27884.1 peptide/nickel transport system substrate-binding protein [Kribbella sp. VKM Ac-2569]
MLRKRFVAALVAVTLGVAGCSPASEPSSGEQVLRYAPAMFPVSLDTHKYAGEEAVQTAIQQIMEPLVRVDGGKIVPVLATAWENPDPNTWVFKLRSGVKFSDGTPFTAKDVVASYERHKKLDGPLVPLYSTVTSFAATDDQTVTVKTSKPLGTLLSSLTLLFIGPADKINTEGFFNKPIGTGPFTVSSFKPDEKLELAANPTYWDGAPKLNKLEFVNIPEVAGRITGLENGEVDVLTQIPPDQVGSVKGSDQIKYETTPSWTYYFDWFNSNRKPFNDKRVRQAMWHALNLEGTVKDLFGDLASVAQAPLAQGVIGAPKLSPYTYDPAKAKQLLTEAGYPNGFTTSMQWPLEGGPNIRALAQAMISDWAKIGVTVKPLEKERAQWLEDFGKLNWDMNLQTNVTGTGDADYTLARLYVCTAKRNGYCNPALDKLLLDARSSVDQAARPKLYQQAGQTIWDDAVGIFPAELASNSAVRSRVQGFVMPPSGRPLFAKVTVSGS